MGSRLSNLSVRPGQKNPIDSNTIRSSSLRDYTPRPALKADGRVLIKDRFGCICEHGCEHGPLPASGSLSPGGVGGHIPRLLGSSLNMPEANRETRHGVAFDRDETKDRPRR